MAKKSNSTTTKKLKAKRPVVKSKPKAAKVKVKTIAKSRASKSVAKPQPTKLPSVWQITKSAALTLWEHRRLFIIITVIYGLLGLILVQGLATGTDVGNLKGQLDKIFTGHLGALVSGFSIFTILLTSSGNSSSQSSAYQLFITLITSLAIIWALRKVMSGDKMRVRDAYYRGMYPLIPFMLVLLVIGLQLIPLIVGSTLYNIVSSNGIAVHVIEKIMWIIIFGLLVLSSLYMLSSSLFALYIVTLPDMTPIKALRSAKKLVRNRRWIVLRKILCLPAILLVVAGLIMIPIIIFAAPLSQFIFFILSTLTLIMAHAYMYTLYRNLLSE